MDQAKPARGQQDDERAREEREFEENGSDSAQNRIKKAECHRDPSSRAANPSNGSSVLWCPCARFPADSECFLDRCVFLASDRGRRSTVCGGDDEGSVDCSSCAGTPPSSSVLDGLRRMVRSEEVLGC